MKKFIYTSEEKKINKVLKMNQEQSKQLQMISSPD